MNPRTVVFLAAFVVAMLPWSNPAIALTLGVVLALVGWTAYEKRGKKLSRFLIQACVVLLGLRVNINDVLRAATEGVWLAVGTIVGTLALGMVLARMLKIERDPALLVSSGTAICGGSAIAAVGASIGASSSAMAVATGAVFVLNAVALYAFPPLGHALGLTAEQFGTWCGVAVHDMSSVAGAAREFDLMAAKKAAEAVRAGGDVVTLASSGDVANIVKLTRVLWIAPIAIGAGWWWRRSGRGPEPAEDQHEVDVGRGAKTSAQAAKPSSVIPWFIVLFVIASLVRTVVPGVGQWSGTIKVITGVGFQAALFLIGAGLSRKALREVGWRALVMACVLWLVVAGASLLVIRETVGRDDTVTR